MKTTMLCRALIAVFGAAILSGAALAQQPKVATAIADSDGKQAGPGSRCTTTTVYVKGNFTSPHPTSPSPALAAFLSTLQPVGYGVHQPNHAFGDSFRICPTTQ